MSKLLSGSYNRKYYVCANISGDFSKYYKKDFVESTLDGCSFLWGMVVFNRGGFSKETEEFCIKYASKFISKQADIELHGLGLDTINLGIFTDNFNDTKKVSGYFIAERVEPFTYKEI